MNRVNSGLGAALAASAFMAFASNAVGSLTPVVTNQFGQPTPHQIAEHIYDVSLDANGENFAGGSVSATRLNDNSDTSALAGQDMVAKAVARFSDFSQSYGVIDNGSFKPAFNVTGFGYNVAGTGTVHVSSGDGFGRNGNTGEQSSMPGPNADRRDHAVTYEVHGANPDPQWLQFWEDWNSTPSLVKEGHTVADYNDLVVQLSQAETGGGNAVPLPPSVLTGAAMGAILLVANSSHAHRKRRICN